MTDRDELLDINERDPGVVALKELGAKHGGIWVAETQLKWPELRFPNVRDLGHYMLVLVDINGASIGWRKPHTDMYVHAPEARHDADDQYTSGMVNRELGGELTLLLLSLIGEHER